ncbi:cell division cycle-associated 7-like protein [Solanum tuberosum]|uniref:Ubiquitin-protein ligase n=1 Tax=Solanum tuberosum TaxID=4113 RepID=M1ATV0_SOLTU|nr:PREDICTED: cell division cycle-associated 7-like protein [Solanum tuberosum]
MVKAGSKRGAAAKEEPNDGAVYEKQRADRIKENKERLHKLGILELTRNLNPTSKKLTTPRISRPAVLTDDPPRRSFRLKVKPPVSYKEKRIPKMDKVSTEDVEINIGEGENPEFYTEEHEKLLGDCQNAWTLYVDGYDEDGQRVYDPDNGKSCHQCRLKTLGQRTACSNCKLGQGQFCGDCLYMRYGENVIETNENVNWICPVCRGICNCSRCRREKGYAATGAIYRKVLHLGYKSVAHYLVKTRMRSDHEDLSSADSPSRKSTVPFTEFTNTLSTSQTDDNKTLKGEERTHCDGDDANCDEEDVNE